MAAGDDVCLDPAKIAARRGDDLAFDRAVMWKVSLRLLPILFLMYVLNILDRINSGFASLTMMTDVGLSQQNFGTGTGIFFVGYFLFEIPSNLMLKRTGARRWIARILISWGLISSCLMFVTSPRDFYVLRFLLGLAEAGFFPGIILYLSYWFPARQRARAVARFMTGSAIAGILGNPISGFIMENMAGVAGLAGWQWLFLIEGIPSVILGIFTLYYLTDRPSQAHWLEPAERDWLAERMSLEEKHRESQHGFTLLKAMANPRVWLLCGLYFTVSMGSNGFGNYLPQMVKFHFPSFSESSIGLLSALPSLAALPVMVVIGLHSDRTGERRWHVACPAFLAATGWLVARSDTPWVVILGLTMAQVGMLSMLAPFWSLPTSFLTGTAAAGGIAMINSIGNLGGFVAPHVLSWVKETTHSFSGGMTVLGFALVFGGCLAIFAKHDRASERHTTTGEA